MNPRKGSILARADLLRVLAAAGAPLTVAGKQAAGGAPLAADGKLAAPCEQDQALAKGLRFYFDPPSGEVAPAQTMLAPDNEAVAPAPVPFDQRAPVRPPLRIPFFGLVSCQPVASAEPTPDSPEGRESSKPSEPSALSAIDFAARSSQAPPFQPLARTARIASRVRAALSFAQPGPQLDDAQIVRALARMAALPTRHASWPRRLSPAAPPRLWVLVDRSMSMRTLWQDQDQLLQCLGKWLGLAAVDTFTIAADPFQPECAWLNGRKQWQPVLRPPPPGTVVLLLTAQPAATSGAARWQQVAAFLAQTAASLWWYAPYGKLCSKQMPAAAGVENAALQRLLAMLACARRIEPALVRAVRLLDPALAQQPQLEAQVWASALLDAGFDVAVWRADQLEPMRRQFAALPATLQQQIWHTLTRQHAVRGRAIEVQETLALAAHARAGVQTAAMQQQVQQAGQWLQGLLLCQQAHNGHNGFASFAAETFCFHARDGALLQQHETAFLQLFAIADAARQQQGAAALDPGALPLAKLATLPKLKTGRVGRYRLCQRGGQLVLQQVDEAAFASTGNLPAFGMGMPLELGWLLLDDGQRRIIHSHGQREVPLVSHARLAQRIASGQTVHLQTPTLAWQLGQIAPPFGFEHGRDEHGLYVLWGVAGQVLRLRYIEPGQFLMGSAKHEAERDDDEGPQHRVIISTGFWLCDAACTQALWQAIMGQNPSRFDEQNKGGPQHPVEQVSWFDVQQFLQKLNQRLPPDSPWQASLPTEAEWEYACRAGSTTPFWFGANIAPDQVNYHGNYPYAGAAKGQFRGHTVAVHALPCNGWGLYQMHGNVWEWCADRYGADAYAQRAGKVTIDPGLAQAWQPDLGDEGRCSVRGGKWISFAGWARSAYRFREQPVERFDDLGFRLALRSSSR